MSVNPETKCPEELYVHGNRVIWLTGLAPGLRWERLSYSVETTVLQALWCQFEDKEGEHEEISEDHQL